MHIDEDVSSLENVVCRCLISRLHDIDPIACRFKLFFLLLYLRTCCFRCYLLCFLTVSQVIR